MNENNETIEDHKTQLALKRPVFRIPSQKPWNASSFETKEHGTNDE